MASAFWGGFANTLKDIRLDDRNREKNLEDADALERLKEKYAAKIVKDTKIIGSDEVRYNQFGDEISRRTLSAEELAAKKAALAKTEAEASEATARAGITTKDFANYDEDRTFALDEKKSIRASREHGDRLASERVGLDRERLNQDRTRAEQTETEKVTEVLFQAGDIGDTSAMALLGEYEAELEAATTKEERKRVIAKYLGEARNRLMKAQAALRGQGQSGGPSPPFKPLDATN